MSAVLTGSALARFQWITLKGVLELEEAGIKRIIRPSARQIVLRTSGLPASTGYDELIKYCEERANEFI